MNISRRGFLGVALTTIATPVIVKAENINRTIVSEKEIHISKLYQDGLHSGDDCFAFSDDSILISID